MPCPPSIDAACEAPRSTPDPAFTAAANAVQKVGEAVRSAAGICTLAAVSVPSVARTRRKSDTPCRTLRATAVLRSYFRTVTGPSRPTESARVPAVTGTLTGPQLATPTMPRMSEGAPWTSSCGVISMTSTSGTLSAAVLTLPAW